MRYASVCDGIGAAHVAWKPLGWQCSWTSEIEPFPAAVVEHHFGFANVGDMTKITEEMLDEHGPVDLLVGGTPCQSFSVAGLRGGLADPRGNLALRFVQLAAVMQPKWIVWENVPGVLSSGRGRDFGTFLGALGEIGYGFAYRVLDAQWFGVAQRRRRVFVVGYLGDWRRAAAVLFERESVFGNPPTRGKAWEGVARSTASSLTSSGRGVERPGESRGQDDLVLGRPTWRGGDQANSEHCIDHAGTLNCDKGQQGGIVAFHPTQDPISSVDGSTHAMGCGSKGGCCTQAVAVAQAFTYSGYSNQPAWMTGDRTDCLPASGHSDGSHQGVGVVSVRTAQTSANGHGVAVDVAHTLDRAQGQAVAAMAVRRLTPRECERLQGFPDDYTLVEYRKKTAADGPRYRALGNSMAVPVMRWIGERIAMVDLMP
jgi:DNA (cytosine-5)-methyltransferase 1